MTEQEITAIANEVLTPILGGSGYAGVEVRPGVWTRDTLLMEPVYRLLDHGQVRKRLARREASELGSVIVEIGASFAEPQERRHRADYSPPSLEVRRDVTRSTVVRAKQTVADLESLDDDQRRRLAVLLITKTRLA